MPQRTVNEFHIAAGFKPTARMLGLDAETVFTHPKIRVWRTLPERENCTLDADLPDGRHMRWHIKRHTSADAVAPEVAGHRLVVEAGVPTADLVAWGRTADGRGFTIFDDLTGFTPADRELERGGSFRALTEPTADLAADLHAAGLHHRDLYLCHFMVRSAHGAIELRLIDTARVRRLPGRFLRDRWIVKDLAQFRYSTLKLPIEETERDAWLERYARRRGLESTDGLRRSVLRKVRSIARHDARLHLRRPRRDVSLLD